LPADPRRCDRDQARDHRGEIEVKSIALDPAHRTRQVGARDPEVVEEGAQVSAHRVRPGGSSIARSPDVVRTSVSAANA
jgi:hypothetical protein